MDQFVDIYCQELRSQLSKQNGAALPDDFRANFDTVWLDYARVVITGLWKNLSHEQIKRYQNVVGPSMITKSLPHVKFIMERAHKLIRVHRIADRL